MRIFQAGFPLMEEDVICCVLSDCSDEFINVMNICIMLAKFSNKDK